MDNLFDKWKTRIPKYSESFKFLFDSLSSKYGAEGEKKVNLGKHFSTNYEFYIYAFFLGLYNEECIEIKSDEKKLDFSHAIQFWGSKSKATRKDFTSIQEYIFAALIAKTDVDLISLEKGEINEDDVIKDLINCMESYTNGGLTLIKEKQEENPNFFLQPTSFLNMIIDSKLGSSPIEEEQKEEKQEVQEPASINN